MSFRSDADPKPDGAFFHLLGIVFALSITVAAAMSVWLPPAASAGSSEMTQLAKSE